MSQSVFTYMTGLNHALQEMHMMGTRTRLVKTSRRLMGAAQGIRSTAGFRCGAMEARVRVGGRGGGGGHGGGGEDEEITIMIIT